MTSTLDIIKQILDSEMEMPANRVWAYNANMELPKDNKLFIILFLASQNPISNTSKFVSTSEGMEQRQSMNVIEEIIISCVSKSTEARDRAHEVHMAMNSFFSKKLQAKNKIHISIMGDVYDASFLEATSRLNRFDCRIRVFKSYDKIKSLDDYYDKFPNSVEFEAEYKIEP